MTAEIETAPPRRHRRRAGVFAAVAVGGIAVGGSAYALSASGIADASVSGSPGYTAYGSSSGSSTSCPTPARGTIAGADGYLSAVSSTSVTVKDLFGKTHTYSITSSTKVQSGRTSLKVTDLTTGEHVHVLASGSKATEVDIHPAMIDGSVLSVSGSTVTVRDVDGFTRTITTASGTTYTKDGTKATSAALASGTVVHAEGTVDSNGTTLDATSVDVRTSASKDGGPLGGPGLHRHLDAPGGAPACDAAGGPRGGGLPGGGPMGHRPGGTPPSGAPALPARPGSGSSTSPGSGTES